MEVTTPQYVACNLGVKTDNIMSYQSFGSENLAQHTRLVTGTRDTSALVFMKI